MKKLLLSLLLLLAPGSLFAQSTTVSGQVTDAGGQTWNNGTVTATFVPPPSSPNGPWSWTGGTLDPTHHTFISGALGGSGAYSISVPDNNTITPTGSKWLITVSSATQPQGQAQQTLVITSGSQTVNFTPARINADAGINSPVVAYTDAEVSAGVGQFYFNLPALGYRVCIVSSGGVCSSWISIGGGGPGGLPRLDQVLDPNISKTFNLGFTTLGFLNGTVDFSNLTSALKLPVVPGCLADANGQICYDSTLNNWTVFNNAQAVIPTLLSSGTYTTGDVLGVSNVGGKLTLTDLGPVNGGSGSSFISVTTTNILDGDTICWDAATSTWINCTPGVPVTTISAASYLIDCGTDRGSYLLFTSTSAIAVTLPQASTSGACDANFFTFIRTLHATLTVTPTVSTIDDGGGAGATLVLSPGYGFTITSDDSNYTARGGPYRESGNPLMSVEGFDVNTLGGYDWQSPNNASPGTILNKMACDDGTGALQTCAFATAATNNPVGSATTGIGAAPGTTGNTAICFIGFCKVIFDGTATANHFAQLSTTVNGDLHDTGSTTAPTNGQPYWYVFAGNSGAGTAATIRNLSPSELSAVAINGGGKSTILIDGTATQPRVNFTTSGGLTLTPTNSGNTTTVAFTLSAAGGITSVNSATGPALSIVGIGATGVSTSGNTISISGGTTGNISGTWINQSGNYTIADSDNTNRLRFTTSAAAITLPQPGTITSSPQVGLKFNSDVFGLSTFTSAPYTQTAGNQMYVAFIEGGNVAPTTFSDSRGDIFVLLTSSSDTNARNDIYYCANLLSSGSTTFTMNWAAPLSGGGSTGLFAYELTGTSHDNSLSASLNGGVTLALTNPIHFQNAMAIAGGRTNIVNQSPPFIQIDTWGNGNIGTVSRRFLANQNSVATSMSGSNTTIFQSILSISSHPAFVAGWLVVVENVSTGFQTITSTSSTINGQSTLVLAPNEICNLMSNGVNWDAVCGSTPNLTNNAIPGQATIVYGKDSVAQVAAITDTTMITPAVNSAWRFTGTINCTTTSAAATATLNLKYTDTGNTAQTVSVTDTCTTLVTSGVPNLITGIRAKASTAITWGVTIANTPTYDVSVRLEKM